MLRTLALCLALVLWSSGVESSVGTLCNEHEQCSDGYYCAKDYCKQCLQCQDLKREQPLIPTNCIKSVIECGGCLKGLVVDHINDVNAECVPPDSDKQVEYLPTYFWPVFVVCLLLIVLVFGVVLYVLRNPETFRIIKASTRTSVESPFMRSDPASAPAPPAYEDACYSPVRPDSPPAPATAPGPALAPAPAPAPHYPHDPHLHHHSYHPQEDESSFLFAKRARSPSPRAGEAREAREAAGTQAARVFNLPAYMRDEQQPSPEGATVTELENDTSFTHDEETVESLWTPNNTSDNEDSNANPIPSSVGVVSVAGAGVGAASGPGAGVGAGDVGLPALLATARESKLVGPSPPKILCVRQDSNNNRGARSASSSGARVVVNNFNVDFYASLQIDNSK